WRVPRGKSNGERWTWLRTCRASSRCVTTTISRKSFATRSPWPDRSAELATCATPMSWLAFRRSAETPLVESWSSLHGEGIRESERTQNLGARFDPLRRGQANHHRRARLPAAPRRSHVRQDDPECRHKHRTGSPNGS